MNVSLTWLKERLDFGSRSLEEVCDLLTFAGIEIEGLQEIGVKSDQIVVAEIKEDDGERVAREIREQGGEAMFAAVDVGSEASTLALAEEVKGALGGIDLLVNNAAIFGDMKMDSLIGIDYEYYQHYQYYQYYQYDDYYHYFQYCQYYMDYPYYHYYHDYQ